ncbi:MAG: lamin tail domain-containing protein [Planctomycetota bacterium]
MIGSRVLLAVCAAAVLTPISVRADWTATGSFEYVDRLYSLSGWTGTASQPIRRADVQVYDLVSLEVLATGATDGSGAFTLLVVDNAVRDVGVRVLASTDATPGLSLRVVDDMNANATYTYHDATRDVAGHAPSASVAFGVMQAPAAIGDPATTDWSSQVFNAFDMGILIAEWVESVDGTLPAVAFEMRWNPNNGRTGSFYSGGANAVSLADNDGYDDANILHELGHFIEDEFGRSRNTGGTHSSSDDDQDPRLSWSEGYATYVSSVVLHFGGRPRPDVYSDRDSFGTTGGFSYSFESDQSGGASQEVAVTAALHDLVDDVSTPDGALGVDDDGVVGRSADVWLVTEEMRVRDLPFTNVEDFWDLWFDLGLGTLPSLVDVFESHRLEFRPDAQEPNDRPEDASVLTLGSTFQSNTFYRSGPEPAGDEDWFRFQAVAGTHYRIEVNGAANTIFGRPDPELFLIDLVGDQLLAASDDPYDSVLNTQNSGSAQDMRETVPTILWRAPSTQAYYLYLRHATRAIHILEYGTYELRVQPISAPVPTIDAVAVAALRPGQRYPALVRGSGFAVGAMVTLGGVGLTASAVRVIAPEMLALELVAESTAADGVYSISVVNPAGAAGTLADAVTVDSLAAPPVVITEIDVGTEDRVELRNLGTVDADLTGWQLIGRGTTSTATDAAYVFGGFVLPPDATVVVSENVGADTAFELFGGSAVAWPWNPSGTGDVSLVDDTGASVDYVRFVRGFVTTHLAPAGNGMLWMQPEIKAPPTGLSLARAERDATYRTTYGLSYALPTMPPGAAGRTNAVDPWEDNDSPRRAPVLAGTVGLERLAISPRPTGEDHDWFGVAIEAGAVLAVRIRFTRALGDLGLEVYAPGEEQQPTGASSPSADSELVVLESATTANLGGGVYRLRVFGQAQATNEYELDIVVVDDLTDCDANGVVDGVEIALQLTVDCDGNEVPDACDLAQGVGEDCNVNGVLDTCDLALGSSLDLDASGVPDECEIVELVRGDCNNDTAFNIADAIRLLNFLFPTSLPTQALDCEDACDANDDGGLDIADGIRLLTALFGTPAPPPAAPYPDCGEDPTLDTLICEGPLRGCP